MSCLFSTLLDKNNPGTALREDMLQCFLKSELDFTKRLLLIRKPIAEQTTIEFCEEDYRLLAKISRWEAKIKEGMNVNEALKRETGLQDAENEEIVQEKELKAKAFVDKVQRDTLERHVRFKMEAEKRLKEMEEEEKQRERDRQKELLAAVKKRQHENILKLQEVIENLPSGEGTERLRTPRKT